MGCAVAQPHPLYEVIKIKDVLKVVIDEKLLEEYNNYYFKAHPRASAIPIKHPYHESINVWMIMRRPAMNALKQRWKAFIRWVAESKGYANLHISNCEINQKIYYPNNRRHDIDNSVPKFILDGLVESGVIVDDDNKHISKLTLQCFNDSEYPRTELEIIILDVLDFDVASKEEVKELITQVK